jgi:hypothetical protein
VRVVEADDLAATNGCASIDPTSRDAGGVWVRPEATLRGDSADAVTLTIAEAADLARHKPADWREWRLGRGKSALLRRLELDTAIAGLCGEITRREDRVTFFLSLSTYAPARPGDPPPDLGVPQVRIEPLSDDQVRDFDRRIPRGT